MIASRWRLTAALKNGGTAAVEVDGTNHVVLGALGGHNVSYGEWIAFKDGRETVWVHGPSVLAATEIRWDLP